MGDDGIGVTAIDTYISAIHAIVRAINILRPYHAGIVSHRQFVVGHKQIVIAIVIYHLGSLGALPAVVLLAGIDEFAIFLYALAPWVAQFLEWHTSVGVELHGCKARMPRTIDEPVLTLGGYDV